ncbi:MAG: hypothetical protein JNK22_13405 [Rhodocyclaceae bacterium]|nr:hypothetical protein [Rhodocyclaceae bacterium]
MPAPPASLEVSFGHEALSSPLFRLSDTGALVRLPGLLRLSGNYVRVGAGGMALFPAPSGQWSAAGRVDWKTAPAARDLDFGNVSGELMWREALGDGQAGIGISRQRMAVAGSPFRTATAAQADWTRATDDGGHWVLLSALARQRHDRDAELDGTVASLALQRHLPEPLQWVDALDLEAAIARERTRFPDLSSRTAFLRLSADRRWLGIDWSAGFSLQRAAFDAALLPGLPVRRDRGTLLEFSAALAAGRFGNLRLEIQDGRNRSNVPVYDNRYRNLSLTLAHSW